MTAIQQWAVEKAEALMQLGEMTPQRLAISLLQARAQEMRHQSTEMQMNAKGTVVSTVALGVHFFNRACKLEEIGQQFAEKYPPVEEPKNLVEVVQ